LKIAITGGVGFIGSNFISFICRKYKHADVLNIDKLTYAANPLTLQQLNAFTNHTFVKCDIRDRKSLEGLLNGYEILVHFAAETHVDRSIENPENFLKTNVLGTFEILEAIRKIKSIKRYIHISTDEVYGGIQCGSFIEESNLNPTNPYSISKAAADFLVLSYYRYYNIPAVILRPTNNFGPFQHPEKFIPLAITNALENKKIPIYGNGLQKREWLFVYDTCKAVELLFEKGEPGQIYNVSGHQERTNIEVAEEILNILGKKEKLITHISDRPSHDIRYSLVSKKIEELGFAVEYGFDNGLEETISWYKHNKKWWQAIKNSPAFIRYYKKKYPYL